MDIRVKPLFCILAFSLFLFPSSLFSQCFTESASAAGIDGYWGFGYTGGGGVSFADFDLDGDDDLSFTSQEGDDLYFYENIGNGAFSLVNPPFVSNTDQTKCLNWIDWDNDGDKDLFVTAFGAPNRLYENQGGMSFTDITTSVGLPLTNDYTMGSNFGDYDQDGWLDVYISNYGNTTPADTNVLYRNLGGTGFEDVTYAAGVSNYCIPVPGVDCDINPGRQTFCSVWYDYDQDGDVDLYMANDRPQFENSLYENNGDGTFIDVSAATKANVTIYAMNTGFGDSDGDGYFDMYVTNIGASAHLVYDPSVGAYEDVAFQVGTRLGRVGWGGQFFDYDNDTDQDLYVCASNDLPSEPNAFFVNNGIGNFTEPYVLSGGLGGIDHEVSHVSAVGDYNNDGFQDIVVTHNGLANFHLWQSCESNGNNYVKLDLEGTVSNKDAYGALVKAYSSGNVIVQQKASHQSYLSQNSDLIILGLAGSTIDSITIDWPFPNSDTTLFANDIQLNAVNQIVEIPINGSACVVGNNCNDGDPCTVGETFNTNCDCVGGTMPDMDGDGICDSTDPCPNDPDPNCVNFPTVDPNLNIVRKWNELLLESIRLDLARPTVHARNLFHTSIAMWDAYSIYNNTTSCPYLIGNSIDGYVSTFNGFTNSGNVNDNLEETISYACYRVLSHRFASSPNAVELQNAYDYLMGQLGYDISITSIDYSTGDPAHLGNYLADEIINFGLQDGSNELMDYGNLYYNPVNASLIMEDPGNPNITDYNRWQPLTLETFIDQSGNVIPVQTPDFLSPEWGQVSNFALEVSDLTNYFRDGFQYEVYHDPGAPPYMDLNGTGDSDIFQWAFTLVSKWSSHLSPDDGVMVDISPVTQGNLGPLPQTFDDYDDFYLDGGGTPSNGYPVNPVTGMPYANNIVPRGDFSRVLAEFWADGPDSETPPGHWFTLLNSVSDHPALVKKMEGVGPLLDDTQWYVKSYFALGGAMHDAAVSAWGVKGWYDYIRPVSAIRAMADLGQSSDSSLPNYHAAGMPLTDGLVELVLPGDTLVGANNEHLNKVKLYTWLGHDAITDEAVDEAGVGWILAENWAPYQRASFVTPPFAGYVSGHSTFSRAAAEVLTMITGDEYFPGGLGTFLAEKDEFLVFEDGPSIDIELQWATYRDAAEQSALSRIWGGIHPPFDDIPGREIGLVVGTNAFNKAVSFFSAACSTGPCIVGASCDDGDPCTTGDAYNVNCNCIGVYQDADGDGVCAANDPDDTDPCNPNSNSIPCTGCTSFIEKSVDLGITGSYGLGFTGGGGVSFADYNKDGYDDLSFCTADGAEPIFYTNNGDGTFAPVAVPFVSNLDDNKSISWIDWDNDGDKDIFLTSFGAPNRLYENDGNMNFTDISSAVGIPSTSDYTIGANFGDYDMDGWLDVYITNYGNVVPADTNVLLKNMGGTSFTDVTFAAGVSNPCDPAYPVDCDVNPGRQTFCSVWYDYDRDGDLDLYMSNDRPAFENALYSNNGDGTFTDVSFTSKSNVTIFAMNTGFGDSNGDGFFDMYVTNIGPSAHLVFDPSSNTYIESAASVGTKFDRVGWGGNFFDYDNDADLDLYVCAMDNTFDKPSAFYVNDGTGNFTEPFANTGGLGGDDYKVSHVNAIGDFDNNGALDIAVSHAEFENFDLWQNCGSNSNNFIKLDLVGTVSNTDAYGAFVEVHSAATTQVQQKASHNAYVAQNSDVLTFGLGVGGVDSITIDWPYMGSDTTLYATDVVLNQVNTIIESTNGGPACAVGASCNDNDPCTINDVYDSSCNCAGVFADADSDGVCDVNDQCPGQNDAIAGTACNDNDNCTINDTYDANCNCVGVYEDADGDGYCVGVDPDDADPCNPDMNAPGCTNCFITLYDNDFETSEGIWSHRGDDCFYDTFSQAYSGTKCFMIRDNSFIHSSMFSWHLDLSSYTDLEVSFTFISENFDNASEEFRLEISTDGGQSYTVIEEWNYTDEFNNNVREFPVVTISGITYTSITQLRFICNASDDDDEIFIDDVVIKACPLPTAPPTSTEDVYENDFQLYPNPVVVGERLYINNLSGNGIDDVVLFNSVGEKLRSNYQYSQNNNLITMSTQGLNSGLYILKTKVGEEVRTHKIVLVH